MGLFLYFLSDPKKAHDATGAIAEEAKIVRNHIPVMNVAEIVQRAIDQCALHREKIKHLVISGHGSKHHMRFGAEGISVDNVHEFAPTLRRLIPYFEPGATVTLWGCEAGQNQALLMKLSFILRVRVQGAIEDISVGTWGPFGYVSSSDMNTCVMMICSEGDSFNAAIAKTFDDQNRAFSRLFPQR